MFNPSFHLKATAKRHGITVTQMTGRRRHKKFVAARWDFIALATRAGLTVGEIALLLKKDHTTISHAIEQMRLNESDNSLEERLITFVMDGLSIIDELSSHHPQYKNFLDKYAGILPEKETNLAP